MTNELLFKCYALRDAIRNDSRVLLLVNCENRMNDDEDVLKLAYVMDSKATLYSDALRHFDENNEIVKKAQHDLFLAKKNLDENPLVRDYLEKYKIVRELYEHINNELIKPFKYIKGGRLCG